MSASETRKRRGPWWPWVVAAFLLATAGMSIAAFVDACDTTGRAHDRAILGAAFAFGGLAFIGLGGRIGGRTWIAATVAVGVGLLAVLVLDELHFGACT